jgi:hypothetical protein
MDLRPLLRNMTARQRPVRSALCLTRARDTGAAASIGARAPVSAGVCLNTNTGQRLGHYGVRRRRCGYAADQFLGLHAAWHDERAGAAAKIVVIPDGMSSSFIGCER